MESELAPGPSLKITSTCDTPLGMHLKQILKICRKYVVDIQVEEDKIKWKMTSLIHFRVYFPLSAYHIWAAYLLIIKSTTCALIKESVSKETVVFLLRDSHLFCYNSHQPEVDKNRSQ